MQPDRTRGAVRLLRALAIAAAVVTGLAGCDQLVQEPVAFTVVDGRTVARICIPAEISLVQIKTFSGEDDFTGTTVWSATGSASFDPGAEFVLGSAPEGLAIDLDGADYESARFAVTMNVDSGRGGSWTTWTWLDDRDLAEGQWLDGWGQPTEVPCGHEDCPWLAECDNDWPIPTGYAVDSESTFVPPQPTRDAGN